MNNSIYDTVQKNRENQVADQFNNFINNFSKQFGGTKPEELGPQLVQSGAIPQNKFEQFRQIANAVTGMNK